MQQKKKKLITYLLAVCMVLGEIFQIPMVAWADVTSYYADISKGNVVIEDLNIHFTDSDGNSHDVRNYGQTTIISGATNEYTVLVDGMVANVMLSGADIDVSGNYQNCAFELKNGASVNLALKDGTDNNLKSGYYRAGLEVPNGTSIEIGGTGSLTSVGGNCSAGIGNGIGDGIWEEYEPSGEITITGGIIDAIGTDGGAGIGGSGYMLAQGTANGPVTILGGLVKATAGSYHSGISGAGIGGGYKGGGGTVTIEGGTVVAKSIYASGIGCGTSSQIKGNVYIRGGSVNASSISAIPRFSESDHRDLDLITLTLSADSGYEEINDLTTDLSPDAYKINGMSTDSDGKIYIWLPVGTKVTGVETSDHQYVCGVRAHSGSPNKTLTSPAELNGIVELDGIPNVTHGITKEALESMLPSEVLLDTNNGTISNDVSWNVGDSDYDPEKAEEQLLQIPGEITLRAGIDNPNNVPLSTILYVQVCAAEEKTLTGMESVDDITDIANGTAKSASALGLPSMVTLNTDRGNVNAKIKWDLAECAYDPSKAEEQTFLVEGTVTLPGGVINPDEIPLTFSINVTVREAMYTNKILEAIEDSEDLVLLANSSKSELINQLPNIILETDKGSISAQVKWDTDDLSYDPKENEEQNFTINGTVILPKDVVNKEDLSLFVSVDVTVLEKSAEKNLESIASPSSATSVANGREKKADELCLPKTIKVETSGGEVSAVVDWHVDQSDYDPGEEEEQTFWVNGTVVLPDGVDNPSDVPLKVKISVTVLELPSPILEEIKELADIDNIENGSRKKASTLGLPSKVTVQTDAGNIRADVRWNVADCDYDPDDTEEQTFSVDGLVILPKGVKNPYDVTLEVSVNVTVLSAQSSILESIVPLTDIENVENGVKKNEEELRLPSKVTIVTDTGNMRADVKWNVKACDYDPSSTAEQIFPVEGTVILPKGVRNPDEVSLVVYIQVSVKKAAYRSDGGNEGDDDEEEIPAIKVQERNLPVTAYSELTVTVDGSGKRTITVTEQSIVNSIEKAKREKTAKNGISISLDLNNSIENGEFTLTLPNSVMEKITSSNVKELNIENQFIQFQFDREAIKRLTELNGSDVAITVTPVTGRSFDGNSVIGSRPVYTFHINYGDNTSLTDFGKGKMTVSIPYKPENESAGSLYAVSIDGSGTMEGISDSIYDENSHSLIFCTDKLATYAIAYKNPTHNFRDTAGHWAEDAMEYMIGHEIMNGTSEKEFSPDELITGEMLAKSLGKISGAELDNLENQDAAYLEWADNTGLFDGMEDLDYKSAVNREEMAAIMDNFMRNRKLPVTRQAVYFEDSSQISSNYEQSVMNMLQAGVIMGMTDNRFEPDSFATRAEACTMLYRYLKLTIAPWTSQGWAKNDAGQYQYYKEGTPQTSWQTIDGEKYYFTNEKVMAASQWVMIDDTWHYFYPDGTQAKSTTIDGYVIDENGNMKKQSD